MRRRRSTQHLLAGLLALLLVALFSLLALAQGGGPFHQGWGTADGGGTMPLQGGTFNLSGTAGQPDATTLSGGSFRLEGGFWSSSEAGAPGYAIYMPLIVK